MNNVGLGFRTNSYVRFKKNEQPKVNQPLAGLISPPTPKKPTENLPAIIYPPPLAGVIALPKAPKPPKMPGANPPLAGLIAPPPVKKEPSQPGAWAGDIVMPLPKKPDDK